MVITHLHAPSPRSADSLRFDDLDLRIVPRLEFDLEAIPDEIDLLAVLWGQIRSYQLQYHPVDLPGH